MKAGIAVCLVKQLRYTDSSYAIFFAQCAIGFWLVAIPANFQPVEMDWRGGLLLLAIGLAAAGAQLMMTWAFRHVAVSTGSLLGMLVPVINIFLGLILFGEGDVLDRWCVAGIVLVLASCALVGLVREGPAPGGDGAEAGEG